MSANNTPNNIDVTTFITAVFSGLGDDEIVGLSRMTDAKTFVQVEATERSMRKMNKDFAWYFCVSSLGIPLNGEITRDRDSLKWAYCLVLDDIGTKVKADAVAVQPSWVLESSEGNFQWGYLLDPVEMTPEGIAHYEGCIRALGHAGLTDGGAGGAYRIMRVPGSRHKTGFEARITQWNPERFWDLDELMGLFELEPLKQRAHTPRDPNFEGALLEDVNDPIYTWLGEQKLLLGGNTGKYVDIVCPWHTDHSDGSLKAGYTPAGFDRPMFDHAFSCMHDHCRERGKRQFLEWVTQQGGPGTPTVAAKSVTLTLNIGGA